jgi:hypothetical protein
VAYLPASTQLRLQRVGRARTQERSHAAGLMNRPRSFDTKPFSLSGLAFVAFSFLAARTAFIKHLLNIFFNGAPPASDTAPYNFSSPWLPALGFPLLLQSRPHPRLRGQGQ